MANKKNRRSFGSGAGKLREQAAKVAVAPGAGKKAALGGASASVDPAAAVTVDEADVALVVSAVNRLLACRKGEGEASEIETLSEALRPLVLARAAKYEEDAVATKLAEVAAGNPASARAAGGLKRKGAPGAADLTAAGEADDADPLLSEEVVQLSKVCKALAHHPDAMVGKASKPLRSALHPLVESHLKEEKASPSFRITCALSARTRWPEAVKLLRAMRALPPNRRPKLGAYQRWVREVNAAEGTAEELGMLDAIMRVAAGLPETKQAAPKQGALKQMPAWQAPAPQKAPPSDAAPPATAPDASDGPPEQGEQTAPSTVNKLSALIASRRGEAAAAKASAAFASSSWSVIAHEAAAERQPPNHFDLDIYTCRPDVATFGSPEDECKRVEVPGVEGAFALTNVFSTEEIATIRDLTESIGYRPDVPLSSPVDERAQNVVLLATEQQNDALFSRVRDVLPQEVAGDKLMGINRRWRLYRYQEGNAYRKHLDGAWPASGLKTGSDGKAEYVYDAYGGSTRSRYTFIVYLNDDFEGGETTYFVPGAEEGTLEARAVRPRAGCATVFPHGDTGVPLLHEGSPVVKGTKYLLRTDVVYAGPESTAAQREARRLRGLARQLGGLGGKDIVDEAGIGMGDGAKPDKKAKVVKKNSKTKNGIKNTKFREKQEAKREKMGLGTKGADEKAGRGGQMRIGGIGKRPRTTKTSKGKKARGAR